VFLAHVDIGLERHAERQLPVLPCRGGRRSTRTRPGNRSARRRQDLGRPPAGQCLPAAYFELDGFKLKPGRRLAPAEEFEAGLRAAIRGGEWLLDGNWDDARLASEVWPQADQVVWLDLPHRTVVAQLSWRVLRRWLTRHKYHGWSQRLGDGIALARWSWRMVPGYRDRYMSMVSRLATGQVVRLQTRAAAGQLVRESSAYQPSALPTTDHPVAGTD
jgi:hypothetical protein